MLINGQMKSSKLLKGLSHLYVPLQKLIFNKCLNDIIDNRFQTSLSLIQFEFEFKNQKVSVIFISKMNDIKFRVKHLTIILLWVSFSVANAQLDNKIPQPILNQTVAFGADDFVAKQYEIFTIRSLPLSYTIGSVVLQRPIKPDDQSVLDPQMITSKYKKQFIQSENCKFNDPDFNITQIWQQSPQSKNRIIDYFLDQGTANLVVLTEKTIEGYTIAGGVLFNFRGMCQLPNGIDTSRNTHFIQIGQHIAISSGKDIYKLKFLTQAVSGQVKIEIVLWQSLQFEGVVDPEFYLQKMIYSNLQIVALGKTFLKVFKYDEKTNKFQIVKNKHEDQELAKILTQGQFVDIAWYKLLNRMFILTDLDGVIQIRNFNTNDYKIIHHQIQQLGICQRFQVFNEFIQIIFRTSERGEPYVAEFFLKQLTDGGSKLILNRFYNQIYPARDVEKFGPHLFILSDNQFRAYGPGVNRKIYLENGFMEAPFIGYNYDIKWINVVERFSLDYQTNITIIGFSQQKMRLYKINKLYPNTTCSFSKDTDLWITVWGSCPHGLLQNLSFMQLACRYDMFYHISITNQLQWWEALLITAGVIAIIVFCTCLNWAFIAQLFRSKGKVNKMLNKLRELKERLGRKGQGSTWSDLNQKSKNKDKQSEMAQSELDK